jgi:rhodanese-related sulfurtransferase
VREPSEFLESRIPGTRNIPLSEVCFGLEELRGCRRVYLSCLSGRRSMTVAKTLSYLGLQDVVNVTGGIRAWAKEELSVDSG